MISQARLESNRLNAKKSTGPRSEEGKRRSSMNAITHGMTAKISLLPDEDEAAFERRMFEWVRDYGPRSDGELFQARRAVYCSWQVERARRSQSARLCFQAETALDEKRKLEQREATELSLRLFRRPGEGRSGAEVQGDGEDSGTLPDAGGPVERDDADHPALCVLGLEATESGCRWLLTRWTELKAVINDETMAWQAPNDSRPFGCWALILSTLCTRRGSWRSYRRARCSIPMRASLSTSTGASWPQPIPAGQ